MGLKAETATSIQLGASPFSTSCPFAHVRYLFFSTGTLVDSLPLLPLLPFSPFPHFLHYGWNPDHPPVLFPYVICTYISLFIFQVAPDPFSLPTGSYNRLPLVSGMQQNEGSPLLILAAFHTLDHIVKVRFSSRKHNTFKNMRQNTFLCYALQLTFPVEQQTSTLVALSFYCTVETWWCSEMQRTFSWACLL